MRPRSPFLRQASESGAVAPRASPSLALGVGQCAGAEEVGAVGEQEEALAAVARADLFRAVEAAFNAVTQATKLAVDDVEAEADVAGDVFEENPGRAYCGDDPPDVGPEVAGIVGAAPSPGM